MEIVEVTETRLTGFVIHAMIAGTLCLLPLLRFVPIPVVSGVFLFLGRKLMSGNSFLQRVRDSFAEAKPTASGPSNTNNRKKKDEFVYFHFKSCVWLDCGLLSRIQQHQFSFQV
jgi:hypothetical protein